MYGLLLTGYFFLTAHSNYRYREFIIWGLVSGQSSWKFHKKHPDIGPLLMARLAFLTLSLTMASHAVHTV